MAAMYSSQRAGLQNLDAVADAEDNGLAFEAGVLAEAGRDDNAALGVELDFEPHAEEAALDEPALAGVEGGLGELAAFALPRVEGEDVETRFDAAGEDGAAFDARAEASGDGEASLVVHGMEVLANEHLRFPTLPHFTPPRPTSRVYRSPWDG